MNKKISPQEFSAALLQPGVVVIDLRTPEEIDMFGTITKNPVCIDVYSSSAFEQLEALDKKKFYALYCFHGNRSTQVRNWLVSQGFEQVVDLEGGIAAWIDEGFEVL